MLLRRSLSGTCRGGKGRLASRSINAMGEEDADDEEAAAAAAENREREIRLILDSFSRPLRRQRVCESRIAVAAANLVLRCGGSVAQSIPSPLSHEGAAEVEAA